VLLADDHAAIIKEAMEILTPHFDVVGAVSDGELLVKAATTLDPDIIVVDIAMPVMNGLEAVAELKRRGCRAQIVFLSVFENQSYVDACFSAGADAYVFKMRLALDLIQALNEVRGGRKFESSSHV
jgi:DNA-binding NarL/FixJ family response regulator